MPSVAVYHRAYRSKVVIWSCYLGEYSSITGKTEIFGHRLEVRRVYRSKRCMVLKIENKGKPEASVQDNLGHNLHALRVLRGSRLSFNF